jgi:hypothetical protein
MKVVGIMAAIAGGLVLAEVTPLVLEGVPITWTHRLNEHCTFDRRPWLKAMPMGLRKHVRLRVVNLTEGVANFLPDDVRDGVVACHVRRGLANPQGSVNRVMRRWPTDAELTAWRSQNNGTDHVRTPHRR